MSCQSSSHRSENLSAQAFKNGARDRYKRFGRSSSSTRAPRLLHPTLWESRGLSYVLIQLLRSTVGRQSVGKSLSGMCKSSFFFLITLTYSSVC